MTRNIEGTVQLDGLIEGRRPADGESIDPRLREWVEFARQSGVRFSLDIDGSAFSVLPDSSPLAADDLGPDPAETIRQLLDSLLQVFTPPQRSGVFSTLRSSEFQPGREVQTIYAIGAGGKIECQQRTVDARTTAPDTPLALKDKIKLAAVGVLAAAVVIGISAIWVPYGQLFSRTVNQLSPVEVSRIETDLGHFAPYLQVASMQTRTADRRLYLVVEIQRTPAYPATDAALQAAWRQAGDNLHERLTLEALARGQLSIDQYDTVGKYIGRVTLRITGFDDQGAAQLDVPISRKRRPGRIAFVY